MQGFGSSSFDDGMHGGGGDDDFDDGIGYSYDLGGNSSSDSLGSARSPKQMMMMAPLPKRSTVRGVSERSE